MGLVVFSTVLGICLAKMGPQGRSLLEFFHSLSAAMMIITNWVVWYEYFLHVLVYFISYEECYKLKVVIFVAPLVGESQLSSTTRQKHIERK